MSVRSNKAPFPWFGGKQHAAPLLWALLGDPIHYVSAFAGALGDLLERPHPCNRTYYSETISDTDGLLVNAWRSIQWHPDATAEAASWPVSECVPAGTRIATPQGDVAIEHVVPGMSIWGHDGVEIVESRVLEAWHHETPRPFVRVGALVLTENHPVWTAEHGYIPARELTAFHHIATIRHKCVLPHCNGAHEDEAEGLSAVYNDVSQGSASFPDAMAAAAVLFASLSGTGPTLAPAALSRLRQGLSSSGGGATALLQSLLVQDVSGARAAMPGLWEILSCAAWEQSPAVLFPGMSQPVDVENPQGETSRCRAAGVGAPCCPSQIAGLSAFAAQSHLCACQPAQSPGRFGGAGLPPFCAWGHSALDETATTPCRPSGVGHRDDGTAEYVVRPVPCSDSAGDQTVQGLSRSGRPTLADWYRGGWPLTWKQTRTGPTPRCEVARIGVDHLAFQQSPGLDGPRNRGGTDRSSRTVYNLHTTTENYFANNILVHNCDKQARQIALLKWQDEKVTELLAGSATWCDPQMAGWWLYAVCCQIGAFDGRAPWTADPVTGRIVRVKEQEPGVSRGLPHLSDDGRGVHHAGLREPGVSRDRPHLSDDGQGVHRPQLREPGVKRNLPHLSDDGKGVHRPQLREPGVSEGEEFHPLTMPELRRWFAWLAARLRHVRIVNGDWTRVCTKGARITLPVRHGHGHCGVFLDPPYTTVRNQELYRHEVTGDLHQRIVDWALAAQHDPRTRIVIAGFAGEYPELEAAGWTVHEWYTAGFLRGGYGNLDGTSQQAQERLWGSPHCLSLDTSAQLWLFQHGGEAP